ncbi:MAG: asparagine synthetase B [Candidatus Bathyarchaeia archaeon]
MGAIAAVLSKKNSSENIVPTLKTMMSTLRHRGSDCFGGAVLKEKIISNEINDIESLHFSKAAIGYNLSIIIPEKDKPQPYEINSDCELIFDGRIFPALRTPDIEYVKKFFNGKFSKERLTEFINSIEGSYAIVVLNKDGKIFAARDPLGLKPLYYSEDGERFGMASEKKALWRVGFKKAFSFPPGNVCEVNGNRVFFKEVKNLEFGHKLSIGLNEAIDGLDKIFSKAVEKRILDISRVAIGFSGGLDSALLALMAKKYDLGIKLIVVGLEDFCDFEYPVQVAEELGLQVLVRSYGIDEVEKDLEKVLWYIEDPNPIKVSIAIPFYWTSKSIKDSNFKNLFLGQGSDELFGGYFHFLNELKKGGEEGLQEAFLKSIKEAYKTNFQRDEKVCSSNKVELRLPFMDLELIEFSLSLPVQFKIVSKEDRHRKIILRKLAEASGLPSHVAWVPKKAIQYSTGVWKALKIIAKEYGMDLSAHLNKVFRKSLESMNSYERFNT